MLLEYSLTVSSISSSKAVPIPLFWYFSRTLKSRRVGICLFAKGPFSSFGISVAYPRTCLSLHATKTLLIPFSCSS